MGSIFAQIIGLWSGTRLREISVELGRDVWVRKTSSFRIKNRSNESSGETYFIISR